LGRGFSLMFGLLYSGDRGSGLVDVASPPPEPLALLLPLGPDQGVEGRWRLWDRLADASIHRGPGAFGFRLESAALIDGVHELPGLLVELLAAAATEA
jgi:hypothetical protein